MAWIAIHEDVLGSKLRGFRKSINSSEAEALGILTLLWLWARKNANESGLLENTDEEDIYRVLQPSISEQINSKKLINSLIEFKWIDRDTEGNLYIHDWYEWQQYWYSYLSKKEKDRERKRVARLKIKEEKNKEIPKETLESLKKKKTSPKKIKYADTVKLTEDEYQKLCCDYGIEFTKKLIEVLDNYKAASGKTYKSDYRAILNWTVDRCKKDYPQLIQRQAVDSPKDIKNPFVI